MHPRSRALNTHQHSSGSAVLYVMSRDQRVRDNYALLIAQNYAIERSLPLIVVFNLYPAITNRLYQHYAFMIEGLKQVESDLRNLQIPLILTVGDGSHAIPDIARQLQAAAVFFDFSPLRKPVAVRQQIAQQLSIPCFEVDTNNIVPLWITSDKEEFSAHTIRSKIHKHLERYLIEPPAPKKHPFSYHSITGIDWTQIINWDAVLESCNAPRADRYTPSFVPGETAAADMLRSFITERLEYYHTDRNNPTKEALSNLSPYFHFGHLSTLRAVLEVRKTLAGTPSPALKESVESFIEESVVRRELAANYCYYQKEYTSLAGAREWARKTLKAHTSDTREHIYTYQQLESAETYDDAWNASQIEMMRTGKMHGYMRMYWAKKILEWSETPQQAIDIAVQLNDTYQLDGYDANGYTGIMWAIAGVHDRPWFERPVFGSIRYMNYNGLKRKFAIQTYIDRWLPLK
jgi:deoxyribodipyrimidine photo-lyase